MTTSASRRKSPARRPSLSSLRLDRSSAIGADTTRQILLLQFAFALGGLAPLTSDWDPPTLLTDAYCQANLAGGDIGCPRYVCGRLPGPVHAPPRDVILRFARLSVAPPPAYT